MFGIKCVCRDDVSLRQVCGQVILLDTRCRWRGLELKLIVPVRRGPSLLIAVRFLDVARVGCPEKVKQVKLQLSGVELAEYLINVI